jgi:hypothetical protein
MGKILRYPFKYIKNGKDGWGARAIGISVIAVDDTKAKVKKRLKEAILFHLEEDIKEGRSVTYIKNPPKVVKGVEYVEIEVIDG